MNPSNGPFETLVLVITRNSLSRPWGFRVQGGSDTGFPLMVQRVFSGSPAEGILQRGDVIDDLNNSPGTNLTNREALNIIRVSGTQMNFKIRRYDVKPPMPDRSSTLPVHKTSFSGSSSITNQLNERKSSAGGPMPSSNWTPMSLSKNSAPPPITSKPFTEFGTQYYKPQPRPPGSGYLSGNRRGTSVGPQNGFSSNQALPPFSSPGTSYVRQTSTSIHDSLFRIAQDNGSLSQTFQSPANNVPGFYPNRPLGISSRTMSNPVISGGQPPSNMNDPFAYNRQTALMPGNFNQPPNSQQKIQDWVKVSNDPGRIVYHRQYSGALQTAKSSDHRVGVLSGRRFSTTTMSLGQPMSHDHYTAGSQTVFGGQPSESGVKTRNISVGVMGTSNRTFSSLQNIPSQISYPAYPVASGGPVSPGSFLVRASSRVDVPQLQTDGQLDWSQSSVFRTLPSNHLNNHPTAVPLTPIKAPISSNHLASNPPPVWQPSEPQSMVNGRQFQSLKNRKVSFITGKGAAVTDF